MKLKDSVCVRTPSRRMSTCWTLHQLSARPRAVLMAIALSGSQHMSPACCFALRRCVLSGCFTINVRNTHCIAVCVCVSVCLTLFVCLAHCGITASRHIFSARTRQPKGGGRHSPGRRPRPRQDAQLKALGIQGFQEGPPPCGGGCRRARLHGEPRDHCMDSSLVPAGCAAHLIGVAHQKGKPI